MRLKYFFLILFIFIIACQQTNVNQGPVAKPLIIKWNVFPSGEIDPGEGINLGLDMEYYGGDYIGEIKFVDDKHSDQAGGIDVIYYKIEDQDFTFDKIKKVFKNSRPLGPSEKIFYNGVDRVTFNAFVKIEKKEEGISKPFCNLKSGENFCSAGRKDVSFRGISSISSAVVELSGRGLADIPERIDVEFKINEQCNIISSKSIYSRDVNIDSGFNEDLVRVYLAQDGTELDCDVISTDNKKQKTIKCRGIWNNIDYEEALRVETNYGCEYQLNPYTVKFTKDEKGGLV